MIEPTFAGPVSLQQRLFSAQPSPVPRPNATLVSVFASPPPPPPSDVQLAPDAHSNVFASFRIKLTFTGPVVCEGRPDWTILEAPGATIVTVAQVNVDPLVWEVGFSSGDFAGNTLVVPPASFGFRTLSGGRVAPGSYLLA